VVKENLQRNSAIKLTNQKTIKRDITRWTLENYTKSMRQNSERFEVRRTASQCRPEIGGRDKWKA
jgi:hypothetical protein